MKSFFNITIYNSKITYLGFLISVFALLFSTVNAKQFTTDTLAFSTDSITSDNALEEQVLSYAEDSIDYDLINKKVYLYNNARVTYGEIVYLFFRKMVKALQQNLLLIISNLKRELLKKL